MTCEHFQRTHVIGTPQTYTNAHTIARAQYTEMENLNDVFFPSIVNLVGVATSLALLLSLLRLSLLKSFAFMSLVRYEMHAFYSVA